MSEQNQLTERSPSSVKDFLALPAYRDRFHEVLGKRANQFMAAIVAAAQMPALRDVEPRSVLAASMVAATLDLPINPSLGMAHIVGYAGGGSREKVAQFQIGYKGYIQLALRSGQYKRLNAGPVNEECFTGYDIVGEPTLDWTQFDPVKEVAGYFCAFEMLNGFTKVVYWPKKQVESHAKRFSQAYKKGFQSSPWVSDFDAMATKTVIKAALTKWGFLSVEMQKAVTHDQGVQKDVDAEPVYIDNATPSDQEAMEVVTDNGESSTIKRPSPPRRSAKGVTAVVENEDAAIDVKAEAEASSEKSKSQDYQPAGRTENALASNAAGMAIVNKEKNEALSKKLADEARKNSESLKDEKPTPDIPRAFLKEGETYETVITVAEVTPFVANVKQPDGAKVATPSISVTSRGGFVGTIMHIGGGKTDGDAVVAAEPWTIGAKVRVVLEGRMNKATGNVQARVNSAKLEESASDESVDVE